MIISGELEPRMNIWAFFKNVLLTQLSNEHDEFEGQNPQLLGLGQDHSYRFRQR